jgi:hypothetical protein
MIDVQLIAVDLNFVKPVFSFILYVRESNWGFPWAS